MVEKRRKAQQAGSRRPIDPAEVADLDACRARLAELRHAAVNLAGPPRRRRRASTLDDRADRGGHPPHAALYARPQIAAALERPATAAELADLAGPALAPESPHATRIARRRERRGRRKRNRAAHAAHIEAQERERAERADAGSDLFTLARLYAHGSSAELAAYLAAEASCSLRSGVGRATSPRTPPSEAAFVFEEPTAAMRIMVPMLDRGRHGRHRTTGDG